MDDSASSGRTNILKKIIGFLNPSSHEDDVTEEEIISMVNEGHEQGVLRASEAEMIHNIRFIWRTSIILSVFYILKTHLLLHRKMRYSVLPSKTLRD